ncbi:MAG: PPC domain-containing protein [Spirochaetes bacterium]|nr:PPC domain-containing protein [Spirochaetota bacterium]
MRIIKFRIKIVKLLILFFAAIILLSCSIDPENTEQPAQETGDTGNNEPKAGDMYEPDNDYLNSTLFTPGEDQEHDIHLTSDTDWYQISVLAGQTYHFTTSDVSGKATVNAALYLYSTNGSTQLVFNDDYQGNHPLINYTFTSSGTYFLKVTAVNQGSYTISAAQTNGDHNEPDNDYSNATPVFNGYDAVHSIHEAGDHDWFSIAAQSGQNYTFRTDSAGGYTSPADTVIYLYGPDGTTLLAENDDFAGIFSKIDYTFSSDGTYFIKVNHYNDTSLGKYYSFHTILN